MKTNNQSNHEKEGEIKEALGRLYKKVGELELTQKSEREQDRKELKAWAQTNLKQTELVTRQTETIEKLLEQLKQREGLLKEWSERSNASPTASSAWSSPSGNMPEMGTQHPEIRELQRHIMSQLEEMPSTLRRRRIEGIYQTLNGTTPPPTSISTDKLTLEKPRLWASILPAIISAGIVTGCLEIFPPPSPGVTLSYLREIKNRVGWTNAKLTRIEGTLKHPAR